MVRTAIRNKWGWLKWRIARATGHNPYWPWQSRLYWWWKERNGG
jgi:hypothetical protein